MPSCAICGVENSAEARFCMSCAAPLAAAEPAREQRKVVTVLFCDLVGSTALGESTDPEALRARMRRYFEDLRVILERHGGTVEKFVGDAVMAVFGAPFPQDDHPDRAMAAAIAMHEVQRDLNQAWQGSEREEFILGIGLSTGKAAAALLGSEERLEYTLVGDTVNLSQRLQDMARPGNATVLSDATYRALTTPPPNAAPLGEITVKGREAPLTAWRVEADG